MKTASARPERIAVVGLGAVGARVARHLVAHESEADVVLVDRDEKVTRDIHRILGDDIDVRVGSKVPDEATVVVLATPAGTHRRLAEDSLRQGAHVVSVADGLADLHTLLALDPFARQHQRSVAVGAGFAPGLSCVLAQLGARTFDRVFEIHVAKFGTGGPACARERHRSLRSEAVDWREGWVSRRGGSGRELLWFPEPIDGHDCYRGALADPVLLQPVFDEVNIITSRVAASRRDRLTMRLPMLRKPHPEGREGAIRVEIRGQRGRANDVDVYGAVERPAVGAAAVAATIALRIEHSAHRPDGVAGLAQWADAKAIAQEICSHGVRLVRFKGNASYRAPRSVPAQ